MTSYLNDPIVSSLLACVVILAVVFVAVAVEYWEGD